jgi:hypothetical protein
MAVADAAFRAPVWLADALPAFGRRRERRRQLRVRLADTHRRVFTRRIRHGRAPTIVDKEVIQAIRDGAFEVVPTVDRFDSTGVWLVNGQRLEPDAVICATGYRRGLERVVGHLAVLDERGLPRAAGKVSAEAGLRFIGFESRPGLIGFVAKQSKDVARRIVEELESTPALHQLTG